MKRILTMFLALIVVITIALTGWRITHIMHPKDYSGMSYVLEMEKQDVKELKPTLKSIRKKELSSAMDNKELKIYALFEDFVIYGDSRVYGFKSKHLFNDQLVFADAGDTIKNVNNWTERLETIQPSNVYIAYGINDLGLQLDKEDPDGYKGLFKKMVNEYILSVVPDAHIYINSIITCTPDAMDLAPNWKAIDKYNAQLKQLCEETGWTFVNNDSLTDGSNNNVYQEDGIHLADWFYDIWAENMYNATESE